MNPYGDYTIPGAVEGAQMGVGAAAIYVAVMIATAAILLYALQKSGFRAMVAVGGGR